MAAWFGSPRTQLSAPDGRAVNHEKGLSEASDCHTGTTLGPSSALKREVGKAVSSEMMLGGGLRRSRRDEMLADIAACLKLD